MKATFVARTGKGNGANVADEVEKRLAASNKLPTARKIPRSTMNRLLSAEPFRNRLGFTMSKGKFEFTHDESISIDALARVADDLASRRLVLGDIWDVDGKRDYLDRLEHEGVLPNAKHTLPKGGKASSAATKKPHPTAKATPTGRRTLIPQTDFSIAWPGRLQRHHQIWEELQFHLELAKHRNAISVLLRVLLELSIENYIKRAEVPVHENDKLSTKVTRVAKHLHANGKIDEKYLGLINKFQHGEKIVSADTLNRYVHSADLAPSPDHLTSLWDSLSQLIILCLQT